MTPLQQAASLLSRLQLEGFRVSEREGKLIVEPGSALTPELSSQIRELRNELLTFFSVPEDAIAAMLERAWLDPVTFEAGADNGDTVIVRVPGWKTIACSSKQWEAFQQLMEARPVPTEKPKQKRQPRGLSLKHHDTEGR